MYVLAVSKNSKYLISQDFKRSNSKSIISKRSDTRRTRPARPVRTLSLS